jgi:basic amino acid/polyamine antiporter, APA family
MTTTTTSENLKREIGARSLALASVNVMVGSGIFVLPALVAEGLGATAILAYFVCAVLVFWLALCFAEVGSKTSESGGAYRYVEDAFGPFAGFLISNIYWIGACVASDAALANALADTLKHFFPSLGMDIYRMLLLTVVFGGLAWLNIRSVKNGLRFAVIAGIGKLVPLVVLAAIAIPYVHTQNLTWTIEPTVGSIGSASLLLFFAFMGFDTPLNNGGEIKNPARTVPLGIFLGLGTVMIIYISIQLVTQGILGDSLALHKEAPLAEVAAVAFGHSGTVIIIAVTVLSILGSLSGEILSVPRILFAGARDGLMPKPLAKVHPRFATPHIAIWIYTSLGFVMAVSGGFKQLAILASASMLLMYLGVALATIKLRKKDKDTLQKGFRIPGGVTVPLLAAGTIAWLLSNLTRPEIAGIAVFIGMVSAVYLVMMLLKKKKHKNNN